MKNLLKKDNSNELNKIDGSYDEISNEMSVRRKIAIDLPWWKSTTKYLRNINIMEANKKINIIKQKEPLVQNKIEQIKEIQQIANETG